MIIIGQSWSSSTCWASKDGFFIGGNTTAVGKPQQLIGIWSLQPTAIKTGIKFLGPSDICGPRSWHGEFHAVFFHFSFRKGFHFFKKIDVGVSENQQGCQKNTLETSSFESRSAGSLFWADAKNGNAFNEEKLGYQTWGFQRLSESCGCAPS